MQINTASEGSLCPMLQKQLNGEKDCLNTIEQSLSFEGDRNNFKS